MKPRRDRRCHHAYLLSALLALFAPLSCRASITVMDTGERYKSRPDHKYGRAFHRGYEYMARLQFLEDSLSLCPSPIGPDTHNLTYVPPDKLPVALLATNIGCPVEDKVKFVEEHVFPKNVVKYLIVDGDRSLRSLLELKEGEEETPVDMEEDMESFQGDDIAASYPSLSAIFGVGPESFQIDADSPFFLDGTTVVGGGASSLGVMHVSSHNYFKLLETLRNQPPEKANGGGPRVILDGGWRVGNRQVIVWMAVSALLSACACTFLLVVHNGSVFWFQQEEEAPQQPQRERRRRLTREQVRRMLPPYIYDGTCLHPYHSTNHPPRVRPAPPTNNAEDSGPSSGGLLASEITMSCVPVGVELSCCSICLDDYEAGDKLRVLPCKHAFHYRCIGRWLAERSATCPLCKTELWDEEEEDSSDEEEEEENAPPVGPSNMRWRQLIELMSFAPPGGSENLVAANAREQQQLQAEGDLSSEPSWWRRWLLQRRGRSSAAEEPGVALNPLSEPLLQAENGQVGNNRNSISNNNTNNISDTNVEERTVEPRPDPPQTGSPERE